MAKLTPGASQGGVQSSSSTQFAPIESGTPTSGINEAPASERPTGSAGPGIENTRRGIH